MHNWFCCLLVTGISLTDEARLELNEAARDMFRYHREEQKIRTFTVEGKIKTNFVFHAVGSIVGIMFEAEVDSDSGMGKVRYLFQPTNADYAVVRDMEEGGEWSKLTEPFRFVPLNFRLGSS